MRSISLFILLAFDTQAFHDELVDKLLEKVSDKLMDRALQVTPLHEAALESTWLAKPGHLATPARTSLTRGAVLPRPNMQDRPIAQAPRVQMATGATFARGFCNTPGARSVTTNAQKGIGSAPNPESITFPGEYPDPAFIAETKQLFPDAGIADVFQARSLIADGYIYLDVRTDFEYDEGHIPGSIHVPIVEGRRMWDSEQQINVYKKENQKPNPDFIQAVFKLVPDKAAPLLVGCSDSRQRTIAALMELEKAGYTHIVGVKGGFNKWQTIYDSKFRRRRPAGFVEVYNHGGDGAGIHGSGAGEGAWESAGGMDCEVIPQKDHNEWIEYSPAR